MKQCQPYKEGDYRESALCRICSRSQKEKLEWQQPFRNVTFSEDSADRERLAKLKQEAKS